ncbi:MAG TPA: heme A synthase, partial [Flavobacteriaceae bacterium]|nr:heme A synthase [Flavobacteriaceae bacterium]
MYRKWVKIALVLVYLVIIAGAMVRMTGSGMGCPDWPKCFGYYIPPTDVTELQWQPERSFKKGQVIIKDEALQVAAKDFTTGNTFSRNNWNLYTKHDYATFNVWHTWIEYINRLFGALSGIAVLIMA